MFDIEYSLRYYSLMNNHLHNTTADSNPSIDLLSSDGVRSLYRALAANDLAAVAAVLAPDATLHVPGTQPLAGEHTGLDAILRFMLATTALTDGGERIEFLDALVGDEHVAAYVHVTAERAGHEPLDNETVHLLRVRDGLVTDLWFHNRDQAVVDAFWS